MGVVARDVYTVGVRSVAGRAIKVKNGIQLAEARTDQQIRCFC